MDKKVFNKMWRNTKDTICFWFPIFVRGLAFTFISLVATVGIPTIIAILVTYAFGNQIMWSEYFPPHFEVGVIVYALIIFIIWLMYLAMNKYRNMRTEAMKYSWDGIKIRLDRHSNNLHDYVIKIKNVKPFELNVRPFISYIIAGSHKHLTEKIRLPWLICDRDLMFRNEIIETDIEKSFLLCDIKYGDEINHVDIPKESQSIENKVEADSIPFDKLPLEIELTLEGKIDHYKLPDKTIKVALEKMRPYSGSKKNYEYVDARIIKR